MKLLSLLSIVAIIQLISLSQQRLKKHTKVGWDYKLYGDNWSGLCATGKRQSPINLPSNVPRCPFISQVSYQVKFSDKPIRAKYIVYKHAIQLKFLDENADAASFVTGGPDGVVKTYKLLQFHYHLKSEHQLDGKQLDGEAHLVFIDGTNKGDFIAVIGFFIEKSKSQGAKSVLPGLDQVHAIDKEFVINMKNDFGDLEKEVNSKYIISYKGSLTTPPCSEAINFHIIKKPIVASHQFFNILESYYKGQNNANPNFRKIQSTNQRNICSIRR